MKTILIAVLLVLSVIDVRTRRLPDRIVLPLGGFGLLMSTVAQLSPIEPLVVPARTLGVPPLAASVAGLALGTGIPLLIGMAMSAFGRPGSIGGGDVKLFGVLGVFLGPAVVRVMLLANLIAAVSISFAVVVGRRRVSTFAFGPYITAAVMIVLFAGHAMPL